jgi:hypothetical protein
MRSEPKGSSSFRTKFSGMNYYGFSLMLIMVLGIFFTGCTQLSGSGPVTPVVTATTLSTMVPATPVPTVAVTSIPRQVVTIIHQISLVKDIKDSELLFSLQVPVEWNASTRRLDNPENFEGFMYQTDILPNDTFYIQTFTNYRSRDQNYRDDCRRVSPAVKETTVTINGITFDRFESTANGRTNVTYVARKVSANERGYLSVLAFSANTSTMFEKEDFDKVVSSFTYYGRDVVSTMPGEEIPRILTPAGKGGGTKSAVGGSSSGSSGGSTCSRSG